MDIMLAGMNFNVAFFSFFAVINFVALLLLIGGQGALAAALLSLLAAVLIRRALHARLGRAAHGRRAEDVTFMIVLLPLMLVGLFAPELPGRLIFLLVDTVLAVYWWDEDRWTGLKKRASSWASKRTRRFSRPVMGH